MTTNDDIKFQTLYIRSVHPAGYRSGQWAKVIGAGWFANTARPVYVVEFIDGERDLWPFRDENDDYEFSDKVSP